MAKGILEFDLPEEREEFETAVNAGRYKSVLWDVEQEIFRPARKYGYSDKRIQDLIDLLDSLAEKESQSNSSYPKNEYGMILNATELISMLEKLYFETKYETLKDEE